MTTQPICIIGKDRKVHCIETHEVNVGKFVSALKPEMETITDLTEGINKMQYPWNFDYYDVKWNEQTRNYDYVFTKNEVSPRSLPKMDDRFNKDISFKELAQSPSQFEQHFLSNLMIIDLPRKQVVNITSSGGGYRFIPAKVSTYKFNDPNVKKKVEACERGKKKGDISKDVICSDLYHENKNVPKGFQASTVYLRGDGVYNNVGTQKVSQFAGIMLQCNPNGTVLQHTASCLSELAENYQKKDVKDAIESVKEDVFGAKQDLITFWK